VKLITAPNVHIALPRALALLEQCGIARESRNGPVLQAPCPVATVYQYPEQRVLFHPERDANPFFHLYESLWMLAGRNDVEGPLKYAKQMASYSDDGKTFHGAYGFRWRRQFGYDQLLPIAEALQKNPEDRRQVLSMWSADLDLGKATAKDVPCNLTATFQISYEGKLDLVVFNRSNDIVWGCYGANAVHFSFLQEYMARWIGVPTGTYTQVSVNWHGYINTLAPLSGLRPGENDMIEDPYTALLYPATGDVKLPKVKVVPMLDDMKWVDSVIRVILVAADVDGIMSFLPGSLPLTLDPWGHMIWVVLGAHEEYRRYPAPERFGRALDVLSRGDQQADWIVAAREWVLRREIRWAEKNL
jgi:hypothetical protein